MAITIIEPEGGWKASTHYVVDVALSAQNPIHRSIFYTGFLNGPNKCPRGYNAIFNPSYEEIHTYNDVHYLKAISEIEGLDRP